MAECIFPLPYQNSTGTSRGAGICAAMTARWIQQSLRFGRDILSAHQLGSLHNIAVAQSAYEIGHIKLDIPELLDTYSLSVAQTIDGAGTGSIGMVSRVCAMNGYIHFVWWPAAGGGHAIGFRVAAPTFMFFDPNFGLFRCNSQVDLVATSTRYMNRYNYTGGGFEARAIR